ncbi:MAG: D-alanyl-D-alanine carboxypeptidase family protein [Alphaproteobacteria bacterium]
MTGSHPLTRAIALAGLVLMVAAGHAVAIETAAKQAIMIDFDTGSVLFAKNADERVGPASMTKMMTVYLLFERLKDGRLSLDSELTVSEKAWRMGGSKMFVEIGKRVKIEDLIRGIVIQSGNDASIVVAEGLGGSEEAFAREMTERGRALGMTGTNYRNASGWPDPDHYTTVRDLAILARATIRDFPEYYHYYAEMNFTFSGIKQGNRNPLLYKKMGADGLKTGHTVESGYVMVASAIRDGVRVIAVAHGMKSMRQRGVQTERLIEWGFREWARYALFDGGETVAQAPVWMGDADTVPLIIENPLVLSVMRKSRKNMKVKVVYPTAIPAPVTKGDVVAKLVVTAPDMEPVETPLLAGADVGERGMFGRFGAAVVYIVKGFVY